jgi:hypothetical protein
MDGRISFYAPCVLFLASLAVAGCDNTTAYVSAGTLVGPSVVLPSVAVVEPAVVHPMFVSTPFCLSATPFQAQFHVVFHAHRDLVVNRFQFEFLDRVGHRSVPVVIPSGSSASAFVPVPLPASPPVSAPTSSPIPLPGTSPFDGLVVSSGSSPTLPFLLQFDCGVFAAGTLFLTVNATDRFGAADVTRVSVGVAGG